MHFLYIVFLGVFVFCGRKFEVRGYINVHCRDSDNKPVDCGRTIEGWGYVNLHCQDNDYKPVDWWYIYKPPSVTFPPYYGQNFSYITSDSDGQWVPSRVSINGESLLVNTLMPMYTRTYAEHMAVVVYQNRYGDANSRTSARGILMVDELGGLLITHTVPAFPNIHKSRPEFPPSEAAIGHLLVCVSLDLESVYNISAALKRITPQFTYVKVPNSFKKWFHAWDFLKHTKQRDLSSSNKISVMNFRTKGNTNASLIVRPPGVRRCLYKHFAEQQQINLNVYGQSRSDYLSAVCGATYGVRNIETISLKFLEEVHYIINSTDRTWFAVSTAASWQQKGAGPVQYWTCTSSVDKDDLNDGAGLLLCIEDYGIWRTFDNLKVNEPQC